MDTISPLTQIQPVGSTTSQGGGKGQPGYLPNQGQIINATVIESQPNNIFRLEIGSTQITAKSEGSFKPGQVLQLEVLKTSPQIELKVVTDNLNQSIGKSFTLLGKSIDISTLFSNIQQDPNFNLSNLSQGSRQTLTNFLNLQQNTLGTHSETQNISQFAEKLGTTLDQILVQGKNNQDISAIKATLSEVAVLVKNLGDYSKLSTELRDTLPVSQRQILDTLTQLAQLNSAGKNADAIINQLANHLGFDLGNIATITQPSAAVATLQNSIFAFIHLLKGDGGGGNPPFEQGQSNSGNQSGLANKDGGQLLKTLIDNLGLKLESLVAKGDTKAATKTLKAALLEIAQQFQSSKTIADTTNRMLTTLEAFQHAQLQLEGDKQLIFPIPVPFVEQGYLIVEDQAGKQEGDDSDNGLNFSLHLTMKELGNIRVDFHNNSEGLYLRFNCDTTEKAEFVSEYQEDLKEAITTTPLLGLSFSDEAEDPASELIKRIMPKGSSMLNTKV